MRKFISAICIATLALGATGSTIATAQAAQPYHSSHAQPQFKSYGSYAYYNGHKGFKRWQPGYRMYDGYWFPPAAFIVAGIFGAIIGNLILNH